jgi:hypothetical protein
MMRLTRRASLVVLPFLLVSVGTASAECAWVLWAHSLIDVKRLASTVDEWTLLDTTETRAQCMTRLEERVNRGMAFRVAEQGESFRVLVPRVAKEGVTDFTRLQCFPDTIDPHGPKGK